MDTLFCALSLLLFLILSSITALFLFHFDSRIWKILFSTKTNEPIIKWGCGCVFCSMHGPNSRQKTINTRAKARRHCNFFFGPSQLSCSQKVDGYEIGFVDFFALNNRPPSSLRFDLFGQRNNVLLPPSLVVLITQGFHFVWPFSYFVIQLVEALQLLTSFWILSCVTLEWFSCTVVCANLSTSTHLLIIHHHLRLEQIAWSTFSDLSSASS